ncbi:esterase/lipase family protein [Leifsonia sp. AG29]|uniref:esterase/lipase family protein n=1 Tax=Leifsonia sp. AG29 TaxID=2598860 RepID=UPI00131D759E|nr:alpha/beta hydrolase [Leifsonia sp. AG29]
MARRIGVVALDYVYVIRHQLRAALDRSSPDALIAGDGTGSPVVVLPGIFETWRFLRPLAEHIHELGHPVHVVTALERNEFTLAVGTELVTRHLEEHDLSDVTIVAHSKGGLIAKLLLASPRTSGRIRGAVTVGTPFAGSRLATFIPIPSVRSLTPSAPDLQAMALNREANARIVSVWGWFDPHVPGGSRLEGARNIELDVGGHFRILARPELLRIVDEAIAEER